jgi:hypothetical protein
MPERPRSSRIIASTEVGSDRGVIELSDGEQAILNLIPSEILMQELIARFDVASLNDEFETSLNFLRAATLRNILFGMKEHERR